MALSIPKIRSLSDMNNVPPIIITVDPIVLFFLNNLSHFKVGSVFLCFSVVFWHFPSVNPLSLAGFS